MPLHDRNFSVRYQSNIPRQVGLAGSSAIIVATLRCLMEFYGVEIPRQVQPSLALSVETEELGIAAGLQDRVIQVYEGLVYMDFARDRMEERDGLPCGVYEPLDPALLPPLYVAYSTDWASRPRSSTTLKAALIALESADSRLQRADSAQFTGLRRAIRLDIERLKAAPYVDVIGMSLRLDTLAHQAPSLPLAMDERPPEVPLVAPRGDESAAARLAREAWTDLKSLIRVQPTAAGEIPLLSPDQQFFLRENLRMRLLSARVALLAHDPASFKADTRSAADWLQRYFDPSDKKVGAALTTLKQLTDSDISIDLPDITASLEAVRDARVARERKLR